MADYEFDVAFSFHQRDEGLATQLNDRLLGRFKTFIYSEQQKILAGRDGEDAFASVYAKRARVVVVFCRTEWGETPFTRIEMTAIRGRAYDDGYDFTLFIPTEDPPTVPRWLPRTRLWFGLGRFGIEGAAAVVEQKIMEAGGAVVVEGVGDRAARFARAAKLREEQDRFLDRDVGVRSATEACEVFKDALGAEIAAVNENVPAIAMRAQRVQDMVAVSGLRTLMMLGWSALFNNVLRDRPLKADYMSGVPRLPGYMPSIEEPRIFETEKWQWEMTGPDAFGFVDLSDRSRSYSPEQLAGQVVKRYMDMSENHAPRF